MMSLHSSHLGTHINESRIYHQPTRVLSKEYIFDRSSFSYSREFIPGHLSHFGTNSFTLTFSKELLNQIN